MSIKTNLSLLIFFTIVYQGMASLPDNINTNPLDLLVRKKRIIDRSQSRNSRPQLQDVGYAVQIMELNRNICSGSILSAHVILTTARCVGIDSLYRVVASTVSKATGNGTIHFVNGKLRHPNYNDLTLENNLALLSILEPIILGHGYNRAIQIYQSHDGLLPPNTIVTSSGWGSVLTSNRGVGCISFRNGTKDPKSIRSISVPTISLQDCRNRYYNPAWISNQMICTHHLKKKCSTGDEGNPLVFGEYLVGVLSRHAYHDESPDIYMNVAVPLVRNWIITHMNHIPTIPVHHMHPHMQFRDRNLPCSQIHACHD